ncbi:MAG: dicarboxylate/amino acid:cation symporter, partial [Acidobacteria bacterium]|nr:dicarboxylate/amino acid:cation symporter [Acidobacteriota bacterium]
MSAGNHPPGFVTSPAPPAGGEKRRTPLHTRIFYGMVAGTLLGILANLLWGDSPQLQAFIANVSYPLGQIFLRLIFMVVIPLVVSALILGIAELGDLRTLGRVGLRTLAFTIALSSISVLIGIVLANTIRPGEGLSEKSRTALMEVMGRQKADLGKPPEAKHGLQIFLDLIPQNPLEAMVNAFRGEILAVMVFALFIGIALTRVERRLAEPMLLWLQAV